MDLVLSDDGSAAPSDSSVEEWDSELEVFPLDVDNEDAVSDEVGKVPSDRAWGNRKSHFYDANELSSSGDELEEGEAKALQKKMYYDLDELDFASHWFEDELKPSSNMPDSSANSIAEGSKQDILKLFISFQQHFKWLLEFGIPAVKLYSWTPLLTTEGFNYLHCKVHIVFSYCINILYCLQHKMHSTKTSVHPSVGQMAVFHKLMLQVSDIDHELEEATQQPLCPSNLDSKVVSTCKDATTIIPKEDNNEALEFYEQVKRIKHGKKSPSSSSIHNVEDIEEEGKRAITFEMARNKGLTPSRKKEQRNPRVKHRNRYRKAIIKRKSQVLPVVSELTQYGGESSGIRSKLARSVALK